VLSMAISLSPSEEEILEDAAMRSRIEALRQQEDGQVRIRRNSKNSFR